MAGFVIGDYLTDHQDLISLTISQRQLKLNVQNVEL